jgi:hypothetical protein
VSLEQFAPHRLVLDGAYPECGVLPRLQERRLRAVTLGDMAEPQLGIPVEARDGDERGGAGKWKTLVDMLARDRDSPELSWGHLQRGAKLVLLQFVGGFAMGQRERGGG